MTQNTEIVSERQMNLIQLAMSISAQVRQVLAEERLADKQALEVELH